MNLAHVTHEIADQPVAKPAAAPKGPKIVAALNEKWRVVDDVDLQWILQRRTSSIAVKLAASEPSGGVWAARSFCNTRRALIRCVREYCGDVGPDALAILEALPDRHPQPYVQKRLRRKKRAAP